MGQVKQINIRNQTYFSCIGMINLKNFESNLLKVDKKSYKNIGIHNIGYIKIKTIDDYEIIYSVNPLYLGINHENPRKKYIPKKKMKIDINFLIVLFMKTEIY